MQGFRNELEVAKTSHKKLKERIRALRRYIILHYALLVLSLAQNGLALFIVVNYPGPYRTPLFLFFSICLAIGLFILFSGLSAK